MHQAGLLDRASRNSRRTKNLCSITEIKKGNQSDAQPLTLADLSGAFVALGGGFSFAFLILFVEIFAKKIVTQK